MKTRLLLFAITIISTITISSCAYTDPRTQYPPQYRTYQDKGHGGTNDWQGQDVYNRHSSGGYLPNGKHDRSGYIFGR